MPHCGGIVDIHSLVEKPVKTQNTQEGLPYLAWERLGIQQEELEDVVVEDNLTVFTYDLDHVKCWELNDMTRNSSPTNLSSNLCLYLLCMIYIWFINMFSFEVCILFHVKLHCSFSFLVVYLKVYIKKICGISEKLINTNFTEHLVSFKSAMPFLSPNVSCLSLSYRVNLK